MNRRSFLGAMLAACAAPAIVSSSSIMRIKPILPPGEDFDWNVVGYDQNIRAYYSSDSAIIELVKRRFFEANLVMAKSLNEKIYLYGSLD